MSAHSRSEPTRQIRHCHYCPAVLSRTTYQLTRDHRRHTDWHRISAKMKKLVKRKHNERVWYAVDKYAATRESVQDEGHQELRRERGRVAIILLKDKPLIRLLVHCSSREHTCDCTRICPRSPTHLERTKRTKGVRWRWISLINDDCASLRIIVPCRVAHLLRVLKHSTAYACEILNDIKREWQERVRRWKG